MLNRKNAEKNERLIVDNLKYVKGLVKHILTTYGYLDSFYDDCYAAASLALVEAYQKFDPDCGFSFRSFYYLRVRGAIIDCIRKSTSSTGRYSKERQEREAKTIHDCSIKQVAVQNEYSETITYDYFDSESLSPEECSAENEVRGLMNQVLADMPEKDRMVLVGIYFEGKTMDQIADEMDITKGWVSRVHKKALERARVICNANIEY